MNISNRDCVVIGIDPGIRNTGWGVIRVEGNNLLHLCHGVIKTEDNESDALRLNFIANSLDEIIKKYKPDIATIEKIFVSNSGESALKLGMARGVALNSLVSQRQIIIKELAARYIKKAITGTGAADKDQIKYMIEKLLGKIVVQSDAADALAIAIAGYNSPNESFNSLKLNYDKKKYSNHKLNNAIRKALDKG
jgi:crossover junction endodeoxyribonuclease RuvC